MNSEQTIATKTKEKTPPEACESGGRWPHRDRQRRQQTKKRIQDSETEECKVCKGIYKKGKGLKIHMTKSGCGKVSVQHRSKNKSETTDIFQEKHHSGDGSRAERTPPADKVKTNLRKDIEKGKAGISKGGRDTATENTAKEKGETSTTPRDGHPAEDVTEIHVEEEIYQEVNLWVKKEMESKATMKTLGKETMKQPGIKDWLPKKETN